MALFSRFIATMFILVALTGCDGRASAPLVTVAPFIEPPLLSEDCPRPALENWLQRSSSLTQELSDTVNNNIAILPERASDVIDQIGNIRAALLVANPPPCGSAHAEAIEEALTLAESYFRAYRERSVTDPVGSITRINSALDQVRALEQELMRLHDILPRQAP